MEHVFSPILDRFDVSRDETEYMMAYYINGLMAIITRWLENGYAEPPERIMDVMRRCAAFPKTREWTFAANSCPYVNGC